MGEPEKNMSDLGVLLVYLWGLTASLLGKFEVRRMSGRSELSQVEARVGVLGV